VVTGAAKVNDFWPDPILARHNAIYIAEVNGASVRKLVKAK